MEFVLREGNFVHVLAVLILLSRLGDVGSTLLVTPNLVLEANPVARRFRRPTFIVGFMLALVPYYDLGVGIMVLVPSVLVTAHNLGRGWLASTLGEMEMMALLKSAARRSSRRKALTFTLSSAAATALAGVVLLSISGGGDHPSSWFALGILAYAGAMAFHGSLFVIRIFHQARLGDGVGAG